MIFESLAYLKNIITKDIFQLLADLNGNIARWSEMFGIPTLVFGIVGILLALTIGFAGYRLIRPTVSLFMAYGGLLVGDQLFRVLDVNWIDMPDWLSWVFAGALALLFAVMAFARASYVWVILAGIGGYCTVLFYVDNVILALGGAVVLAVLASYLIRTSYVLVSGIAAGLLTTNLLFILFPKATVFNVRIETPMSLIIAGSFAMIFILTQFATNRYRGERLL